MTLSFMKKDIPYFEGRNWFISMAILIEKLATQELVRATVQGSVLLITMDDRIEAGSFVRLIQDLAPWPLEYEVCK